MTTRTDAERKERTMRDFYETKTGQIIRGEPVKLPVVAVIWKGSDKAGWEEDDEPQIVGETDRLGDVRDLLFNKGLALREGNRGSISLPRIVNLPLSQGDRHWPAHIIAHATSHVRA